MCLSCIHVLVMYTCACHVYMCLSCIHVLVMYTCACHVHMCLSCIHVHVMQERTGDNQQPAPGGAAAGTRRGSGWSAGGGEQETSGGAGEASTAEHRGEIWHSPPASSQGCLSGQLHLYEKCLI